MLFETGKLYEIQITLTFYCGTPDVQLQPSINEPTTLYAKVMNKIVHLEKGEYVLFLGEEEIPRDQVSRLSGYINPNKRKGTRYFFLDSDGQVCWEGLSSAEPHDWYYNKYFKRV